LAFARLLRHNQRLVEEFRAENARLTTALAAAEAARDAALAAIRDLLWILHHDEIKGMESNAWIHGMRYSDKFLAEANRRREAAEQLAGWGPTDG
jgi:HEAT repeat protein